MLTLGFASAAIPLHLLLRRELRDAPSDIREQGWPIQLAEVLFLRYVLPWMDVEGLENLPNGSYVVASNHAYKSGLDGFLLGHLLATKAGRVPRIVITGEARSWTVTAERWILHHYGIALLTPPAKTHIGLTDAIARYLRASDRHSVIIFPAGRAAAKPEDQLKLWSTGVVTSAQKSGCPIVPVAIGGPNLDSTPESLLISALHAAESQAPFHVRVRIGKPISAGIDSRETLERLRSSIAHLMQGVPELDCHGTEVAAELDSIQIL